MNGFFPPSDVARKKPLALQPDCGSCGLYRGCVSPKMPVDGDGVKKVLIIAEAPGKDEDERGRPLVGKTGTHLKNTLLKFGVDMRRDCWLMNSLSCRPPRNEIKDRRWVDYCRPKVVAALRDLRPRAVVLLGAVPVRSLVGWLWKEDPGGVNRWAGYRIPLQADPQGKPLNCWVCPAWHPSHVVRENDEGRDGGVVQRVWEGHLGAAFSLGRRPWKELPDYPARARAVHDPDEAAALVRRYTHAGNPVAFDTESNMLKPDGQRSRLVCASVSDGETSIGFPWHGEAVRAVEELLRSDTPKWMWNAKHDLRWVRRHLGFWARNVEWDGMLCAHVLDNRSGTKSLKFQAFVRLGALDYGDAVKPYFQSKGSNEPNRINEVGKETLYRYAAMDTLFTWEICRRQMKEMGVER